MNRQTVSTFKPLAAALLAALGIAPLAARAATIVVANGGDIDTTPQTCTLRQAIVSMNAGAVTGTGCTNTGGAFGSNDTINFDPLTFLSSSTITLATGNLSITDTNLTIDATANGNVTIDAHGATRVMYDAVNPPTGVASLSLNHLTLINGRADSFYSPVFPPYQRTGGGICIPFANFTLSNSTLSGNEASVRGGGIFARFGKLTLINDTISGNSVSYGTGGGIYSAFGSATLTNSTVSGNSAINPSGPNAGGGIYTGRGGSIALTNSTLSGNSTNGFGGGIYAKSYGVIRLYDSTLSNNSAKDGGGIYMIGALATLDANNSIVAGNIEQSANGTDTNVTLSGGANNLIGGNPKLNALASNGGPTQTMMPQAGSPAINAAPCLGGGGADQRGYIRPDPASRNLATPCDIGAVEANSISDEIFRDGFDP